MILPTVNRVAAAIVTYGDRLDLLEPVVQGALTAGAASVIVADNGASARTRAGLSRLRSALGDALQIVTLPRNTGSAGGYRAAINHALQLPDTDFIWLLDDDTRPSPDALRALQQADTVWSARVGRDRLMLLSFRQSHQSNAAPDASKELWPPAGAFLGFHYAQIPQKLLRRIVRPHVTRRKPIPEYVSVPAAPYSGCYFHRSLVNRIGLPLEQLVLYADDTEFTARVLANAGKILLITGSKLIDLETSWNVEARARFGSGLRGWLWGSSELRVYYAVRNQIYFESLGEANRIERAINKLVYLAALSVIATLERRRQRYALLLAAVADGEAGRLGIHPQFPLP